AVPVRVEGDPFPIRRLSGREIVPLRAGGQRRLRAAVRVHHENLSPALAGRTEGNRAAVRRPTRHGVTSVTVRQLRAAAAVRVAPYELPTLAARDLEDDAAPIGRPGGIRPLLFG